MTNDTKLFGLDDATMTKIQQLFAQTEAIDKVIIYGSRAKGNYKAGSDIDLTLIGEALSYNTMLEIEIALDDLLLPYQFDLSLFAQIDNAELKTHINCVGKIFYQRQS